MGLRGIWNGGMMIANAMRSQGARLASVMKKRSVRPSSEGGDGLERRTRSNRYFPVNRRKEREKDFPSFQMTRSNRCFSSARIPSSEDENGLKKLESCARIKWRNA